MGPRDTAAPPDPATTLAATAGGLAEELVGALEAAAGRPVKGGAPDVASLSAEEVDGKLSGTSAAFCLELSGPIAGRAAVVLPGAVASGLAGLLGGLSGPDLTARARQELVDADLEALAGPVAGALVGAAEKLSAYVGATPGLGLGDALLVRAGAAAELLKLLGGGPYPAACFPLEVEGLPGATALIVFPRTFGAIPATDVTMPLPGVPGAAGEGRSGMLRLHPNVGRILRLKMQVAVVVAEKEMDFESVAKLNPGTIIEFDKSADDDLDLVINGRRIGAGQVVIISERFGIQLRHIEGIEQRIRRMGAGRK